MSWLYSQALVEEFSVDTFLDGAQKGPRRCGPKEGTIPCQGSI